MLPKDNQFTTKPPAPPTVEEEKKTRSSALVKAQSSYYEKNKATITAKQMNYNKTYNKLKYTCPCGLTVSNCSKYNHIRSKRHNKRMEHLSNQEQKFKK